MALVALVSARSKLGFTCAFSPGMTACWLICILSIGNRSQKLSWYCPFKSSTPLSSAKPPLYRMLYLELSAWEMRDRNEFLLVEHAITNTNNAAMEVYLSILVFKVWMILFLKLLNACFSIP